MCFKKYLFSILLLSILIEINSIEINRSNRQSRFNDFVIGEWTPESRQGVTESFVVPGIPNQMVNGSWSWQRENSRITLIEAFDLNEYETGGYITAIGGGIGNDSVTLVFASSTIGEGISFMIHVGIELESLTDFTIGELQPNSTLLHTGGIYVPSSFGSRVRGLFVYNGKQEIHFIEGNDQSRNEIGGYVLTREQGANNQSIKIMFESKVSQPIEFSVQIYGA